MNWKIETDETKYLWICFIIPFLTLADIGMTVVNVYEYQEAYPELQYEEIESNIFATWSWRQFGFRNGTYFAVSIILALVTALSILIYKRKLPLIFAGFFLGAYTIVIANHIHILAGWYL